MYKINKRSLLKIQICAQEKQNRLTLQAEYGIIIVLGGLLAACFFVAGIRSKWYHHPASGHKKTCPGGKVTNRADPGSYDQLHTGHELSAATRRMK